jgi:outer membrane protein
MRHATRTSPVRRALAPVPGGVRRGGVALALAVFALAGCQNSLFRDAETPFTVPEETLRAIEPLDTSRVEYGPPVPPDEAIADATAGGFRPTQYERTRSMSIAEVRALTLANNLDLRVQLVAPEIAKTTISQEEAKFDSTFFADFRRNGNSLLTQLQNNEGLFDDQVQLGLTVPLATGGAITFQPQYTDSAAASGLTAQPDQGSLFFSISQPLLRNAGVDVNTASIRVAKLQGQITDARTKLESIRVLAAADRAYWNHYRAFRELEVRKQQYDLALLQLGRAKARVAAGDAPEVEIMRAESGVGTTLENVILADAAVRNRQRDLKRLLNDPGMPMSDGTAIIPATAPNPLGLQLDAFALADQAVRDRMEMLELELQLAVDATNVEVTRNAALPLFTFDYTYQLQGQGNGFSEAFSNIGNDDQFQIGARAEVPISNEVRLSQARRAVLQRVQRLATRDARAQTIRQEVLNAVDNLETAWQRILAARLATVFAARAYDAERRQFEVGLRTSIEVIDAATRLGDAQTREVNALAAYEIALIDAAFATGTMVGGARIRWDELDSRNPSSVPYIGNDGVLGPVSDGTTDAKPPAVPSS